MKHALIIGSLSFLVLSCSETAMNIAAEAPDNQYDLSFKTGNSSQEDADYWYHSKAEITSYKLQQARYGEIHEGTATFVFVTEPFSTTNFVKADTPNKSNVSVLKLNQTRKFNTGIYPYSIMTSTFLPFKEGDYSIKVSSSSQEWCGHTYMEVQNPQNGHFGVKVDSYFEGETFEMTKSVAALMEDDIWTIIRLRENPPTGRVSMYPSLAATRLLHIEYKPYSCNISMKDEGTSTFYTLEYPGLDRTLTIEFEQAHPHKIVGWIEINYSGYGGKRKLLTTTATRMNSINTDYWNRNSVADSTYRKELNL
ncbi:MAG: septum formation inhibitor Maf [Crocinitomicaceae bacterium]|nr:septum formation inhibitor Maf [Crocinitomicaceae bacterium]